MFTQLIPDQISKFWPVIKYAVEESLPPLVGEHKDKMNRMLSSMLSGKLEVWVSYKREDLKFEGIVVTQVLYDEAADMKNLLIYCLYGYTSVNEESWGEGIEALVKYAKEKKCMSIIAYSTNEHIIDIAKKLGADTSYTFIRFAMN